jgi:hypothetical protein
MSAKPSTIDALLTLNEEPGALTDRTVLRATTPAKMDALVAHLRTVGFPKAEWSPVEVLTEPPPLKN